MKRRKKILIADDEPHIIELIRLTLGEEMYDYDEALDGIDALRKIRSEMPDLVLLDVMMPKKNGYEVCIEAKADRRLKSIPIVMVSAKTQERDIIQGLRLGADHYLTKPFDPLTFEKRISEILEGKPREELEDEKAGKKG